MPNCTHPRGTLDAENDIVGPGALTAFFATAAITYFTVIYAYITDALDKDLINPFDAKVVKMARKALIRSKSKTQDPESEMSNTASSKPGNNPDAGGKARKDAISNFLISLSDQQLVTGLAVLVAAVSGQQSLTGYDFSVALSLGWFSCTTHLVTIDVLRVRFKRHGIIRDVRVAGLVCLMGLLSYAFIRTTSITDFKIPVDCPQNAPWVHYTDIVVLLPVWVDYFSAVRNLYLGPAIGLWDIVERTGYKLRGENFPNVDQLTEIKLERRSEEIEDLIEKREDHVRTRLGLYFYDGSFIETFPDMTYSFCFGIAQIVGYRWQDAPMLSEESTEMGFGQITALLLLLLPFLAIGEAYTSYRASRRSAACKREVVLAEKLPGEDNHGPAEKPDKVAQACSQAPGMANPSGGSDHPPSGQSSRLVAGSLQQATDSDSHINMEHTGSDVPDACRGSRGCIHANGPNESPELTTSRLSLMRRYDLEEKAESKLGLRPPMAFFALHLCIGIIASVFLNLPNDGLITAGTILNILSVVMGNLKSVRRLLRLLKKIKSRRTKK